MGKKKHGHRSSSSSSSSSSDSSDDQYKHLPKHERKRQKKLRKQMKKGKIPPGSVPGMYPGGPHGMPHGGHHGAPGGAYPGNPSYPPHGQSGYPTGVAPPPGQYAPGPAGYPAGHAPGYPAQPNPSYPGQAPGYPGQVPGYPGQAPGYPGQAPGYPAPGGANAGGVPQAGGFVAAGGPATGGVIPPPQQPAYSGGAAPPPQPGYPAPAQQGYPGAGGVPPQNYPGGGPTPQQPGYSPTPGQPGYAPAPGQPGQAGYGQPTGPIPGQQGPGAPGQPGLAGQFGQMNLQGQGMPRPTVTPAPNFSAEKDAEVIRKAMKGVGTDEQAIIGVITKRSNQQRQQIASMFKTMYGKDLIDDLKSELSGDFREAIMAMFKPTTFYDAWSLHEAMDGIGTKDSVLIEILCTRTNAEIREINQCFQQHYKRSLEKEIMDDTSGHFKRLLVSCCQANRAELTPDQWARLQAQGVEAIVDRNLAREDAQRLFQAGEKKLGTDESTFLSVLAVRNHYQMRATFEEYAKIAGRDILSSIDREMSGDLKQGFTAIVLCAKNRPEFFANKLYGAMKGVGTSDSTLIRIVMSRSEIDLQDIKDSYQQKYGKTLASMISSDTSGDFKRLLLGIVGV
ncbi:annexin-B12-like isoform X2 [Mya arenaria]|uniref:annexin-B12-like isoform X2 n=1 Tax=Mya arenaria TaxID=6604 RepID=UPI0022E375FE|nr:annexin-B12-like isoform X2 [Mya arenaria]